MKTIIHILIAALIGVLIVLAAYLCLFVDTLTRVTADLPNTIDGAIAREGILTRQLAGKQIEGVRNDLVGQIKDLRGDAQTMERDLGDKAERQIQGGLEKVNSQLTALNATVDNRLADVTGPAGKAVTDLTKPAQNTMDRVSDTADLAFDCDHNPDCAFNRYVGTARAIEKASVSVQKMADTIEKVTPETSQAVKSTSKDLSVIVNRFAKPTTWIKNAAMTAATVIGKFLGL